MKNIELTEEHKSKLLEMCNELFPKEGKWFEILCGNIYYSKNGKFPGKSIHWFEFCITHLITKLYNISNLKNESSIKQLRGYVCQDVEHPVDYLYKQFKQLTNEKNKL